MKNNHNAWLKGKITIKVKGGDISNLVNQSLSSGLSLSYIRWTSQDELQCEIPLNDFFSLRKINRKAKCKVYIVKKQGFPFLLKRLEKRWAFATGIILFFFIIYILSSLIWSVDVVGNEKLDTDMILQAAKKEGIYPLQWSFRMDDTDVLSKKLVTQLPGTTWVGIEKSGTKIKIQIVEMTLPDTKELKNPRNLIASADAVVTRIIADKGKPVVRKNTRVKKGQTLISGVIGSNAHSNIVVAEGEVRGLVWYEYKSSTPLVQKYNTYTGEQHDKTYITIGKRALQISGFENDTYEKFETLQDQDQLVIGKWKLPFGRLKETVKESRIIVKEFTEEEAKKISIEHAKTEILKTAGHDAKIIDQIILHETVENGKVDIKVLFEVEQSITKEQPIIQMQGD